MMVAWMRLLVLPIEAMEMLMKLHNWITYLAEVPSDVKVQFAFCS